MNEIQKLSKNDEKGLFFTNILLEILQGNPSLVKGLDWGCADGERTEKILKNIPNTNITAIDIVPEAVTKTRQRIYQMDPSLLTTRCKIYLSDNFSFVPKEDKFDFIMANPPQMPNPRDGSPLNTVDHGGTKGTEMLEKIILESKNRLSENGVLLLSIFDFLNTCELFKKHGLKAETVKSKIFNIRPGGTTESMLPFLKEIFPDYNFGTGIGMSVIEAKVA